MTAPRLHILVDAQLSPAIAVWIESVIRVRCSHVLHLGLRSSGDTAVFAAVQSPGGILLSKDQDFVKLVRRHGAPPALIWLRCGNRSDAALSKLLAHHLPAALALIASGETIVEIGDPSRPVAGSDRRKPRKKRRP